MSLLSTSIRSFLITTWVSGWFLNRIINRAWGVLFRLRDREWRFQLRTVLFAHAAILDLFWLKASICISFQILRNKDS